MSERLHILHTNDFHNNLKPTQAGMISSKRDELGENCLLLDAGDAISAGNVGVRLGGEPILGVMSDIGYQAMTMGNREFHISETCLKLKINRARFPVLCANMRRKQDDGVALPVDASVVKVFPNGVRVGVFGLTVPMVTPRMAARAISAFLFDDAVETAQKQIGLLRGEVDVLIALTHIGLREDERLARSCPELDLIVGGHSHVVLTQVETGHGAPIAQAGWFAHYLGHVILDISTGSRPIMAASTLINLTA